MVELIGAQREFIGLIYGDFIPLTNRSISNIIQQGGTILETSRAPEFSTEITRTRAAENLRYRAINGLIVISGDGGLVAARVFAAQSQMLVMFIPATINNDVPNTNNQIGFDMAVNTVLQAIGGRARLFRQSAFLADRRGWRRIVYVPYKQVDTEPRKLKPELIQLVYTLSI